MDDLTIGELGRRLDGFERRIEQRLNSIDRHIESLQFVHRDTYNVEVGNLARRVDDLEESKRWFARGLITALLFPVLVAIILAVVLTQ